MSEKTYLMRHGLTESNKKNIYAGWGSENLTTEGANFIKILADKIKGKDIDILFTSPIRRALHTAEILNSKLNKEIIIEENLKEMKMGPWEGLSEEEVEKKYPDEWEIWNTNPSRLYLKGSRESLGELQKRALIAIKNISKKSCGLSVLAVTHVALIRLLIIHFNNIDIDIYRKISVPNGSVFKLQDYPKRGRIERIL